MSSFIDTLEACYSTRDLYEILGVDKSAKEGELRRAYLRLSLKVHPDRVAPDQVVEATNKFQASSKHVYVITILFFCLRSYIHVRTYVRHPSWAESPTCVCWLDSAQLTIPMT